MCVHFSVHLRYLKCMYSDSLIGHFRSVQLTEGGVFSARVGLSGIISLKD